MPKDIENRNIEVQLDHFEISSKSKEMANLLMEGEGVKSALKKHNELVKERINEIESLVKRLARTVSTGREFRVVPCEWSFNFDKGEAYLFRTDNGKLS